MTFSSQGAKAAKSLGPRGDAGQFLDQFVGQLDLAIVLAADLADVGRRLAVGILHQGRALDGGEQLADLRGGEHLVAQAGQ